MTLRVGHYVERYPVPELRYVYDQILAAPTRNDYLIAYQRVSGSSLLPTEVPVDTCTSPWYAEFPRVEALSWRVSERLWWMAKAWRLGRSFGEMTRSRAPDVIHAHFGMAGARFAAAAGKRSPAPLVTTFYGADVSQCLRDPRWLARYTRLFEIGSAFIVLTDSVVPRLVDAGCPSELIRVWNIGIDFSLYPRRDRQPSADSVRLLCAARFVEKKGHSTLLRAVARLRQETDVRLTLMGYGPLLPHILSLAEDLGLTPYIRVVDTSGRSDFDELFANALVNHDVFALPSTTATDGDDEGGPALTVVCAQASGMPVVVTRFAGAERSVAHGVTGRLCDDDPESLATELAALIDDPIGAHSIGRAGSEHVREAFSLDRQRAALDDIYRAVT
jgi:colanic acid/amylovoran biosynthesis glycosyltransferase